MGLLDSAFDRQLLLGGAGREELTSSVKGLPEY